MTDGIEVDIYNIIPLDPPLKKGDVSLLLKRRAGEDLILLFLGKSGSIIYYSEMNNSFENSDYNALPIF